MADYDFQTLMNAASAADKAGDTEGARTLINAARALQTEDVSLLDRTLNVAKRDGEKSLRLYKNILKAAADIGASIPDGLARAGEQTEDFLKEVDKMLRAVKQMDSAI